MPLPLESGVLESGLRPPQLPATILMAWGNVSVVPHTVSVRAEHFSVATV
jgi:hypothetical protein